MDPLFYIRLDFLSQEASVFYFEKKVAEKLHKPKRKETITEILRFSVRQLDRLKHPKLLTLYHPIEESNDALAFATEPVLGTLANVLGCLEERLPQNLPPLVREYSFLDLEIKYGLLQLTEALCFLHYSCKLIHRNLCPQSVIINKRGTWKLAGLEFAEKCNENDIMKPVPCQAFTSKLPKMGQPDLDYTAPEVQNHSKCSPLSDMFSLGLVICAVFNGGHSLIEANLSCATYQKQLEMVRKFD
ncbi:SCY1-like protein 2 [Trichonephila inaurata madagascariensis]|uniref:SCY1-like protein 2 n=1 Tax=Trichonephila inaurata madagascariensis TaxID=2747483 RepID=A0A8X7CK66_9ARAC|nr:SCY1-like protein 2 [Trichonephila inaurata madagascariensis]